MKGALYLIKVKYSILYFAPDNESKDFVVTFDFIREDTYKYKIFVGTMSREKQVKHGFINSCSYGTANSLITVYMFEQTKTN